jgi:hypothetical protein
MMTTFPLTPIPPRTALIALQLGTVASMTLASPILASSSAVVKILGRSNLMNLAHIPSLKTCLAILTFSYILLSLAEIGSPFRVDGMLYYVMVNLILNRYCNNIGLNKLFLSYSYANYFIL